MAELKQKAKYRMMGKTLFFPSENLLAVGDLHLGYEEMLRQKGLEIPIRQLEETLCELERILDNIKARYGKIGEMRVVFLGDIKHHFGFMASEREEIKKLISFFRKKGVGENRVIFVRGNHERNDKSGRYCDYYILRDIAFIHGNRSFVDIFSKEINLIVMAHLHPTIILSDKMEVKREKYKCFLVGRWRKKDVVILPSFISATEGVSLSEFDDERTGGYDTTIVSNKELGDFEVFVASDIGEETRDFGKLGEMKNAG